MMKAYTRMAATATAVVLLAGCSGGEARDTVSGDTVPAGLVRAVNVEVQEVRPGGFTEVLGVTGVVRANRDVVVSAEESGRITRVLVEKGAALRAGQPLLRIDDEVLRTQLDQARAVAELARETHERRKRLWEEDRVGSELAYLQSRYEAEQAAANLATLRARLERTTVRAPIDGILEERRVEVGTMVAPGTPVVRIVDVTPVKVSGGVPERFAAEVSTGREVEIVLDALGERIVRGTISFVGSTVSEQSRTFPIEVEVPNAGGLIKPEMVANIRLPLREVRDALVVPQQALVRSESGFMAYVVVERDGAEVAERRNVVVGATQGNEALITAGLEAGDRVVVVGQQKVADGDAVVVVEREGASR
ncbi:MAG TPA: efflux RND transporter periplasmic adaptor subunit [Longimicrobiales bacterium]|nr:efflux RND transporter periplasmic adaptor subunit [Longimicrobiales bacterium]